MIVVREVLSMDEMSKEQLEIIRVAFGIAYEVMSKVESIPDYYGEKYATQLWTAARNLERIVDADLTSRM